MQLAGIRNHARAHDLRAERRVRVEALGEVPLGHCAGEQRVALQLAAGHVVAGEVAANVAVGICFRHVLCVAGDDEAEFAFVVGLVVLRNLGDDNGGAVVG